MLPVSIWGRGKGEEFSFWNHGVADGLWMPWVMNATGKKVVSLPLQNGSEAFLVHFLPFSAKLAAAPAANTCLFPCLEAREVSPAAVAGDALTCSGAGRAEPAVSSSQRPQTAQQPLADCLWFKVLLYCSFTSASHVKECEGLMWGLQRGEGYLGCCSGGILILSSKLLPSGFVQGEVFLSARIGIPGTGWRLRWKSWQEQNWAGWVMWKSVTSSPSLKHLL